MLRVVDALFLSTQRVLAVLVARFRSFVGNLDDHAVLALPHGRVGLRSFVDTVKDNRLGPYVVGQGELHGVLQRL